MKLNSVRATLVYTERTPPPPPFISEFTANYAVSHKRWNGPLVSSAVSPLMLNLFVLASASERNAVNARLKEGRGGVRTIWKKRDLSQCGLSEVFQQILTEHAVDNT